MGFPRTITNRQVLEARILRDRGVQWEEVARRVGASRGGLAKRIAKPEDTPEDTPDPGPPCGENAAYRRHIDRGEVPCVRCLAAHKAYRREWKIATGQPVLLDAGLTRDLVAALLQNMTQAELARETGLTKKALRNIRDGAVARVLPRTAEAVARVAAGRLPEEVPA